MKKLTLILLAMLAALPLMAQKPKVTTDFAAETLPADLQEYLNKSTSVRGDLKESAKVVVAFGAAYAAMDGQLQQRVTNL